MEDINIKMSMDGIETELIKNIARHATVNGGKVLVKIGDGFSFWGVIKDFECTQFNRMEYNSGSLNLTTDNTIWMAKLHIKSVE